MNEFKIGEIVDIHIKGVRIARPVNANAVTITDEHGITYPMPPQAAVERVVWPPQPGDLWRDSDGHLWLASGWSVESVTFYAANGRGEKSVKAVRSQLGPLTLVHREEGETDG